MQEINKDITQIERISAELISLNKNITEKDRADYMDEENISRFTLSKYMNGKGTNADVAINMLLFFRKKIEEREKLIINS